MLRILAATTLAVLAMTPQLLLPQSLYAQPNRPNIVLILADDMGYGDLKSYNPDSQIATPSLDRLAAEGVRFTDAHTTGSTCIPARFGLMTGTYPFRQPSMRDSVPLIPPKLPTLASILQTGGYKTAMVGKWHLGFTNKTQPQAGVPLKGGPVDHGFDQFFGIHASTDIPPYYYIEGRMPQGMPLKKITAHNDDEKTTGWNRIQGAFWRAGGIGRDLKLEEVTPLFFDKSVEFIAEEHKQPFFLYLALPSPHTPWLPTEEFVGRSGAGSYGDFLMTVDHGIGRVLKQLEDSGHAKNTLVMFSSDNGPVWYDKDVKKYGHASVGPLRGMKGDNWEGGHRMPFIARWPGRVPAGAKSDTLISFLDVAATLAELTEQPKLTPKDSISFLQPLLGEKSENPRRVLAHGRRNKWSIRSGDWKLLLHRGSAGFSRSIDKPNSPEGQLYNLAEDVSETKNLWEKHPEKVAELKKLLQEVRESQP